MGLRGPDERKAKACGRVRAVLVRSERLSVAIDVLFTVVQAVAIMVAGSIVFDVIHWLLHRWIESPRRALRWVGSLHAVHHAFLDRQLVTHPELTAANFRRHLVPEVVTQVTVATLAFLVMPRNAVILALVGLVGAFLIVAFIWHGRDHNHRPSPALKAPLMSTWVEPSYHMLHHVYPDSYFSSIIPLFDRLFGTGCQIAGRRIAMTGASGAFGAPLKDMLERAGAVVVPLKFGVDWTYDRVREPHVDDAPLDELLGNIDILALCHGSKIIDTMDANCTSFVGFVERFKRLTAQRQLPPEVWAVGSEIEAHPTFGIEELKAYKVSKCAYARHARRYFHDRSILYRHVVPSAFTSVMGPGLISGRFAARFAFELIRRGVRYVPVTYTGIALLNFPSYLLQLGMDRAPAGSVDRVPQRRLGSQLHASPAAALFFGLFTWAQPMFAAPPAEMPVRVVVELEGENVEDVVQTWFSEDFANAAVPVSNLKWRKLMEDTTANDGNRRRRVRMEPDIDLPEFLREIVASEPIIYDELSTYDPRSRVLAYAVESKAQEAIRYAGRMQFSPTASGARVLFQAGVEVDAPPGVSGIVASIVEANVEEGYVKLGDFLRRYLADCRAAPGAARAMKPSPGACVAAKHRSDEAKAASALSASTSAMAQPPKPAPVSRAPTTPSADRAASTMSSSAADETR